MRTVRGVQRLTVQLLESPLDLRGRPRLRCDYDVFDLPSKARASPVELAEGYRQIGREQMTLCRALGKQPAVDP